MTAKIIVMKTAGEGAPAVEAGGPAPENLLAGSFATRTWNHFTGENGRLFCGVWDCAPGKVKIDYKEWEFCHVIEGEAILTNQQGEEWILRAGDAFIIPAGFKGTWETVEKLRKHYVILNPP